MRTSAILSLLFVLLVLSTITLGKKVNAKKLRCTCTNEIEPVCAIKTNVTYPSACVAKCMGKKQIQQGACKPLQIIKVKNVCTKAKQQKLRKTPKKLTKFEKATGEILREVISRTVSMEKRIKALEQRIGKVEQLKGLEQDLQALLSAIPSNVRQQIQTKKQL